ncbi:MAG TPA: hypothetical protein VNF29_04545 [Candidatus Binataceae bacterium]|nr:hypothetical protein [Candidatus Binataceae bacterium]
MRLTRLIRIGARTIVLAAIAILPAAAVSAQTTLPTPIAGPRLPPGVNFEPPHPIAPTMRKHAETAPEPPIPQFPPTREQMKLAHAYIKAVNDGDAAAFRKLIAPKALACFNQHNEVFLDEWIGRQLLDPIPKPYRITIENLASGNLGTSRLFTMPVMPTHQMDISTRLNGRDVVLGRPIVYEDGHWYEIAPCPTDLGVRHSIRRQDLIDARQKQDRELYNSLPPAFKQSLLQLLLQNKGEEACQKTSVQLKVDARTGCRVANVLARALDQTLDRRSKTAAASSLKKSPSTPAAAASAKGAVQK